MELSQPRGASGDRAECHVVLGWGPGAEEGHEGETKGI